MPARSAGIALWRHDGASPAEVLLGHLGGPFWAKKDDGAWSIPKGLVESGEDPLDTARREFAEELGLPVPAGDPVPLGEFRQSSNKTVLVWSLELPAGDVLDLDAVESNTFEIEWPPRSGRMQTFPEIDRAAWFDLATARTKVSTGAVQIIEELGRTVTST